MPFAEVADRVWVAHYEFIDINIGLIGGERGLVVVDTYASTVLAREVIEDVRALGVGQVVAAINTHEHFDHTFGNVAFREEYGAGLPIHATEEAAERTIAAGQRWKGKSGEYDDPRVADILATEILPADHTFSSAAVIDLGDRAIELVHPGRGHTGGDLVVRVPDADVLLAGDLVEESAPPVYGGDSYPLDWPHSLDLALNLATRRLGRGARVTAPSSTGRSCRTSARTSESWRRPSATSPDAACRSPTPSAPRSGRSRPSGWPTPYAAATNSCPGPRSGCR